MRARRGFSLIELSVVLVLISLATAMVVPNLSRAYNNFQFRGELSQMMLRLRGAGFSAFEQGKGMQVTSHQQAIELLQPAPGWEVEVLEPLIVRANGICLGGALRLENDEFERIVRLLPPYCEVDDET